MLYILTMFTICSIRCLKKVSKKVKNILSPSYHSLQGCHKQRSFLRDARCQEEESLISEETVGLHGDPQKGCLYMDLEKRRMINGSHTAGSKLDFNLRNGLEFWRLSCSWFSEKLSDICLILMNGHWVLTYIIISNQQVWLNVDLIELL